MSYRFWASQNPLTSLRYLEPVALLKAARPNPLLMVIYSTVSSHECKRTCFKKGRIVGFFKCQCCFFFNLKITYMLFVKLTNNRKMYVFWMRCSWWDKKLLSIFRCDDGFVFLFKRTLLFYCYLFIYFFEPLSFRDIKHLWVKWCDV